MTQSRALTHPVQSLITIIVAWKAFLLFVALCSPGPGYDTSTTLATRDYELPAPLTYVIDKLTRWDAIYFVKVAARGYRYEQEWAWGWGYIQLLRLCTAVVQKLGVPAYDGLEAIVAIVIAHTSHLLSVLVLYLLSLSVFAGAVGTAFTAAALHILSPAGLFLSAPYAESSCAFLTFAGCLLFAKSLGKRSATKDLLVLLSGLVLGLATAFRSNGLLNGVLLLEEASRVLYSLTQGGFQLSTSRRLLATGLGGLAVAIGFLFPQYIAYSEYCSGSTGRPWCERTFPSVYVFVQAHYWNNGLFNYWTLSNLPLFILGAPMFTIMTISGLWALRGGPIGSKTDTVAKGKKVPEPRGYQVLRNLAVVQLLLALYTLTTAHAQIINRISSSSPVWLWYLAVGFGKRQPLARNLVAFMVIYAVVQGGLFASFLPPA
ncbi:GPI mannosyltransferase 2 [Naviculisporaceae sp. PSN 640]